MYKIGEFAKMIGVSCDTLRRWDNAGIFRAYRTLGNQRYYTNDHVKAYSQNRPESILRDDETAKRA